MICLWTLAAAAKEPARDPAVQALLDAAKASHSDSLVVLHDGKPILTYHRPGSSQTGLEMMSATKSLVGLAVGRLITQKKLKSVDQPVSDFYPEWKQGQKAKITLRMLLNHTSGLQNVMNTSVEIYPAPDEIKLGLAAELSDPPGTRFAYNNKAMNLIAGIVEKASGERMDLYIERELLGPMGIEAPSWNPDGFDKAGNPYAMAGWNSTAEDAAKVGQLVLEEGRWNGKTLIDPGYLREMVAQSQPFTRRYGLLWWRIGEMPGIQLLPQTLDRFEKMGIDRALLEKLRPLAAHVYQPGPDVRAALAKALGSDLKTLFADIKAHGESVESLFDMPEPIVGYEANGYLGQYIEVIPKAHLVAVRQIEPDEGFDEKKPWPYGFDDFAAKVIAVAKTFTPNLAVSSR